MRGRVIELFLLRGSMFGSLPRPRRLVESLKLMGKESKAGVIGLTGDSSGLVMVVVSERTCRRRWLFEMRCRVEGGSWESWRTRMGRSGRGVCGGRRRWQQLRRRVEQEADGERAAQTDLRPVVMG